MAKKINSDLLKDLDLGLDTKESKETAKALNDNQQVKSESKEINNFLTKKLVTEEESRIAITISSYKSIERKFDEMKKAGLKINRSTIYRNAIEAIYENWKKSK